MDNKLINLESDSLDDTNKNTKPSKIEKAINFAKNKYDLWHSSHTGYITVNDKIYRLDSDHFKQKLRYELYRYSDKHYTDNQLTEVSKGLETFAIHEYEERKIAQRFCINGDNIYIDCSDNEKSNFLQVAADTTDFVNQTPFEFLQSGNQKPWEVHIEDILEWPDIYQLLNIADNKHRSIIRAFMLCCFNPDINYPILQIVGKKGSGKTTLAKFIKWIVDPSTSHQKQLPAKEDDMIASISNEHITVFDNIRNLTSKQQDSLCRISTGETYAKRKLHTDNSNFSVYVRKPIILTSLLPIISNNDLIDRSLNFHKKSIEKLEPEQGLKKRFEKLVPKIRGRLVKDLQIILGDSKLAKNKTYGRMAGFESFVSPISELNNISEQSSNIRCEQIENEITDDELLRYIYNQVLIKSDFEITTIDIKDSMQECSSMTSKAISKRIKQSSGLFNELGIETDFTKKQTKERRRIFRFINNNAENPSDASKPSYNDPKF